MMNIKIIAVLTGLLATAYFLPAKMIRENKAEKAVPARAGNFEPVAVIELFTSQGCSSCPPADRLLASTIKEYEGKKLFALSYHVDYWNRLGWKDPFSTAAFSQRQAGYVSAMHLEGPYTPQMIVNGKKEFVGSDEGMLKKALSNALSQKASVSFSVLNVQVATGSPVSVEYRLEGDYAGKEISFALVSLKETTSINRGENSGRTLINEHVVMQLITQKAVAAGTTLFAPSPVPAPDKLAVIAFVQQKENGTIAGAAIWR